MSFQRKVLFFVYALLIALLLANLAFSVVNSRHHFYGQLRSISQDAATSLGLTLSTVAADQDEVLAGSIIDAIFDSGDYRSIGYFGIDGRVIVSRSRELSVAGVPQWFADLVELPSFTGKAEVVSGWYQLGSVHVVSSPSRAHLELWESILNQLWVFTFVLVAAYGSVALLVKRLLLPIRDLELKVDQIGGGGGGDLIPAPKVPEFKRVIEALNRMSRKLRDNVSQQMKIIESLRIEKNMDVLSGLPNRTDFDARVSACMASEAKEAPSALVLISIQDLKGFNSEYGREFADHLIIEVADSLKSLLVKWPGAIIGRRSGADFALFISGIYMSEIDQLIEELRSRIDCCPSVVNLPRHPVLYGVSHCSKAKSVSELLSAADLALREEGAVKTSYSLVDADEKRANIRPAHEWLAILESALKDRSLQIFYQAVYVGSYSRPNHYEALCRLDVDGELMCAGAFWPLVERFGLCEKMDKAVIDLCFQELSEKPELCLSLNISLASILNPSFMTWFERRIRDLVPTLRARLIVEVPESILRHASVGFKPLVKTMKHYGLKISIDRFGLMSTSMASIQNVDIDFIKLDRRFIVDIIDNSDSRLYVQTLSGIAHSCDIALIMEGLESQAEFSALEALNVDGMQGFLLAQPVPSTTLS